MSMTPQNGGLQSQLDLALNSAWGNTTESIAELVDAAGLEYLYNGKYGVSTDRNGLYYMRARYYNQDIKRFINRDVVSGDITNSQSLNRYRYVQGNPVSHEPLWVVSYGRRDY
ncbi:MAG: hypothetical protein J6K58_09950 [Lachnospiraceae bacterium]|nr:hypothetical protein [Lachnospiraceae bacterium]